MSIIPAKGELKLPGPLVAIHQKPPRIIDNIVSDFITSTTVTTL